MYPVELNKSFTGFQPLTDYIIEDYYKKPGQESGSLSLEADASPKSKEVEESVDASPSFASPASPAGKMGDKVVTLAKQSTPDLRSIALQAIDYGTMLTYAELVPNLKKETGLDPDKLKMIGYSCGFVQAGIQLKDELEKEFTPSATSKEKTMRVISIFKHSITTLNMLMETMKPFAEKDGSLFNLFDKGTNCLSKLNHGMTALSFLVNLKV